VCHQKAIVQNVQVSCLARFTKFSSLTHVSATVNSTKKCNNYIRTYWLHGHTYRVKRTWRYRPTGLCKSIQATCCRLKCAALLCCQLFKIQLCGIWVVVDNVQGEGVLEFCLWSGKLEDTWPPSGPLDTDIYMNFI
jgi:hypothetical protein